MRCTIQIGILDVDGFGGLVISQAVQVVGWGHEHLQHSFSEARLKHHAAAPHTHVLTARVQVVDAHRDCRSEKKEVRPCIGQHVHLFFLPSFAVCFFFSETFPNPHLPPRPQADLVCALW